MFSFYDQKEIGLVVNEGVKLLELAEKMKDTSKVLIQCRPEAVRADQVLFTDREIIYVQAKDLAGHNESAAVLPYQSVLSFAVETAGGLMGESGLRLDLLNGKSVTFRFKGKADVTGLASAIRKIIRI